MTYPHDKVQAWAHARLHCAEFLAHNKLDPVNFIESSRKSKLYGYYAPKTCSVYVSVRGCRSPSYTNYSWAWPGYKADTTVLGVTAHELGHACHHQLGWRVLARSYRTWVNEVVVTSYALVNTGEAIAEAIKVFVTNPTLLSELWPKHYEWLVDCGFRPIVTAHWSEILAGSPRHLLAVMRKRKHNVS